jgi:elongation factor P
MISTNQFKNGNHIEVDGTIFRVQEFQHVKPGKGPAFVRTKLKRVSDGAVIDKTFRAGEKFRAVRNEVRKMQFHYSDGTSAHMMDMENYEQLELPQELVGDELRWIKPNEEIDILYVDEAPSGIQLPASVELEVTETDPGLKGDTVSGGGDKPATLETGVTVKVPLFVNVGDRIKVQTASGEYISRV